VIRYSSRSAAIGSRLAARHQIRDHAIDADSGKQRGENSEHARERGHQALGKQRLVDQSFVFLKREMRVRMREQAGSHSRWRFERLHQFRC